MIAVKPGLRFPFKINHLQHSSLSVQMVMSSNHQRPLVRFFGAGLMLALWLVMVLLTVSPQLHHLLHEDSQDRPRGEQNDRRRHRRHRTGHESIAAEGRLTL